MDIEDALKLFEEEALRIGRSKGTIDNYKPPLRKLAKLFSDRAIEDVTPSQIQDFLNIRWRRDKAPYSTLEREFSAFKFFYTRVLNKNYDFKSVRNPAPPRKAKLELFTKDEVKRLLEATENSRDRLMFALMYHFEKGGKEIGKLRVEDIKKQKDGGMAIRFSSGELGKLPASLIKELKNYLTNSKPTNLLFVSTLSKTAYPQLRFAAFNEALDSAGIDKKHMRSLSASHAEHTRQYGSFLIDEILESNSNRAPEYFVDPMLIDELRQFKPKDFDLKKLIRLCEELNGCYSNEWYFATAILQRAIMDHVPPIFECENFSEVANNYSWGKSLKAQMEHLQKFARTTADNAVHGMVRNREILLSRTQVDFRSPMSTLLTEIIRILG